MDGQVLGRRIEAARSGVEGRRGHLIAGVWVASLLAILGFLVVYPVLTLLLGFLSYPERARPTLIHPLPQMVPKPPDRPGRPGRNP